VSISIRAASVADIEAIQRIARQTWPSAYGEILSQAQIDYMLGLMYSHDVLVSQMTEKGHRFFIASNANGAIAFAGFEPNAGKAGLTKLHKLYCLPDTQGKGVGAMLIDAVEQSAREFNKPTQSTLALNVNKYNKALSFYQRLGFAIAYEEVIDIGNGFVMDDYVLTKPLNA
jgi:diamine N-acetyltransferase